MGDGRWAIGDGRWAMGDGRWAMGDRKSDPQPWFFLGPRPSDLCPVFPCFWAHQPDASAGYLELAHARVRWFLSVNADYLPDEALKRSMRTFRSITVDGKEIEFSGGFTDLHTQSYAQILNGRGFGLQEARASIDTVYQIRRAEAQGLIGDFHPFCRKVFDN